MFSLCSIHDIEKNLTVSISIKEALINDFALKCVVKLTVVEPDKCMSKSYIYIDSELFEALGFGDRSDIVLYDRDKKNKQLNDRLLIIRLRRLVSAVCPKCFFEKLGLRVCD